MTEHQPGRATQESRESVSGNRDRAPASTDPVRTPPRTPQEQAALDAVTKNLARNTSPTNSTSHAHAAGGHHGHEHPAVTWGVKQPFAIIGYFFSLAWQGLKRWGEMAGKGGGGAKKAGDDHGGGGGHH